MEESVFLIHARERYVMMGVNRQLRMRRAVCINPDGKTVVAYHDLDIALEKIDLRGFGWQNVPCHIQASSPDEAVRNFWELFEEASFGLYPALLINEDEMHVRYPACPLMNVSSNAQYICGSGEDEDGNGEYGMCVLEGYDEPLAFECPAVPFLRHNPGDILKTGLADLVIVMGQYKFVVPR